MNRQIRDYAIIGNTQSAALVSSHGSIDWCCLPRFDSPAFFLRILDDERGGYSSVNPPGESPVNRAYVQNTNVLQTILSQPGGELTVTDFMPVRPSGDHRSTGQDAEAKSQIIRLLRCTSGAVECTIEVRPTFGNASEHARIAHDGRIFTFRASSQVLHVQLGGRSKIQNDKVSSVARLEAGDTLAVVLTHSHEPPTLLASGAVDQALAATQEYWQRWVERSSYKGEYRDAVIRSALVLKLLTYEASGAMVAAPTTSLLEWVGGRRNWDYRYSWLRDSSLALAALMNLGYFSEARDFAEFLRNILPSNPAHYQTMYRVGGETDIDEQELTFLSGYRNSRPVRIGNGAVRQTQLDMFGELAHCIYLYWKHPNFAHERARFEEDAWPLTRSIANYVADHWESAASGIWEMRGDQQQHTHAKAMCWVALDRALKLAADFGVSCPEQKKWLEQSDLVCQQFSTRGYNHTLRSYVQTYGSAAADAALLRLPLFGVVRASDERMRGTVDFIERELLKNGQLYRYRGVDDGLNEDEGTFTACAFWLVENYVLQGRIKEAERMFEHVLSFANDVGLMSEEIDPNSGELLGNFPQGFTHIALINAAVRMTEAARGRKTVVHSLLEGEERHKLIGKANRVLRLNWLRRYISAQTGAAIKQPLRAILERGARVIDGHRKSCDYVEPYIGQRGF